VLDLRRLNVLRSVAREGSFSAAARVLGYTQPAVSHHIQRLEAEVGTALLVRAANGARLTEAGRALVEHADTAIAQLAMAEEEVAEIANLRAGRVRVAAFPSACSTLVPTAARALKTAYPKLAFSLTEVEPPEALQMLRAGETDIAVTFDYPEAKFQATETIRLVPLVEDHLVAVLPQTGRNAPLRIDEMSGETWIAGCERCRSHLLHLAQAAGFAPQIAFASDDPVTVQALVAAGLGVALLPSLALRHARRQDVDIVSLAPVATRQTSALVAAGQRQPPAISAMLDALEAAARAFAAAPGSQD
jgi:molybdate transport repressor ModE-like protein